MPQLPDIQSVGRVSPQSQRASVVPGPRDNTGQTLGVVGAEVQQEAGRQIKIAQKVMSREDAIRRVRQKSSLNQFAVEEITRLRTEEDITDPDTVKAFGVMLRERSTEILGEHKGGQESRQLLERDLEEVIAGHAEKFGTEVTLQQKNLIDNEYEAGVRFELQAVEPSTDGVLRAFDRLRRRSAAFAPALTRDEEEDKLRAAQQKAVEAAVQPLLDTGTESETELAAEILGNSEIRAVLNPDKLRSLDSKVRVKRFKADKGRREGEQELQKVAAILGVSVDDIPPAQRRQIAKIKPTAREELQEQIQTLQEALGPDFAITQSHIEKLAGADVGGDDAFLGKGLLGRALARVTDDAAAFANDLLSPDDEARFIASVVELQQPTNFQNPDTGLIETRQRELAPFVAEALRRREREDLIRAPVRRGPALKEALGSGPGQDSSAPQPGRPEVGPTRTVFEMADDVTGPLAAATELLSRTPVVGEFIDAPQVVQARKFVGQMTRDLVRVLQNNPRFSEGERVAIERDVTLEGEVFDTASAFKQRLAGIDDALAVRQENAFKTAQSALVSREERQHALNVLNALQEFRDRLGVPPLVRTPQEAGQLPPGTIFRDPQGVIRRVPEGDPNG